MIQSSLVGSKSEEPEKMTKIWEIVKEELQVDIHFHFSRQFNLPEFETLSK